MYRTYNFRLASSEARNKRALMIYTIIFLCILSVPGLDFELENYISTASIVLFSVLVHDFNNFTMMLIASLR